MEQVRDSSDGANGREQLKLSQQSAVQVYGAGLQGGAVAQSWQVRGRPDGTA